jgi:hypothetical protein
MNSWAEKIGAATANPPVQSSSSPSSAELDAVQDADFESSEVEELARTNLDFLAALAMPLVFRYFFPAVFKAIWNWLLTYIHKTRDFSQLAIGLPRGFAKTTFIKIFLLYVILFTKRQFILVCAHSIPKAVAIISDICDFLDEPNIKKVFGDWRVGLETDQQVLKKFGFRGRNIILAAGTVESVRGLNVKHQRPDVMLFDDIQSRQDSESEVISKQLETDLYGTAMKAKSPHGCLFIFVANMYPTPWSLLKRLKNNPTWMKFIAGGILSDGTSLWEDLQPISQLLVEYSNDAAAGRPEVFYAEVLNDENVSVNHLVDLSKLPAYPYHADDIHQGNFIVIDPATDKANADAVSIMYFEVFDQIPVCMHLLEGRLSPGDTIIETLKIALEKNCTVIGIESNAYQYTLKFWFEYICMQRGIIGIDAVEVYSGSYSKNSRILTMFKALLSGELYVHPSCLAPVTMQVNAFNYLKRENTDGLLDCLTYAGKMIEMYGHLMKAGLVLENQLFDQIRIPHESVGSPF